MDWEAISTPEFVQQAFFLFAGAFIGFTATLFTQAWERKRHRQKVLRRAVQCFVLVQKQLDHAAGIDRSGAEAWRKNVPGCEIRIPEDFSYLYPLAAEIDSETDRFWIAPYLQGMKDQLEGMNRSHQTIIATCETEKYWTESAKFHSEVYLRNLADARETTAKVIEGLRFLLKPSAYRIYRDAKRWVIVTCSRKPRAGSGEDGTTPSGQKNADC